MQTPKTSRGSPKESPKKVSPRPTRPLKINPVEHNSPSSSNHAAVRTPKDRNPKVVERRSPRSPISERRRPSKLSELESQISQLQNDLKNVKDQLVASETSKREAQQDAEQVKSQLENVSVKLEESRKQYDELISSKEGCVLDIKTVSLENDQQWQSQIESIRKQHSVDLASLASALDEIQRLKLQLEIVNEKDSTYSELQSLKDNLAEKLSYVETMKHELEDSRKSEARAQEVVKETLLQLEVAKETVNALRSDIVTSSEAYNSITSELEQSRARVSLLEDILGKFNRGDLPVDQKLDVTELELELQTMKSDVGRLKSALEATEMKYNEERSHSCMEIRNASELLEQIKAQFSRREAELQEELKNARANIEELKADLMDKETELQGISEENNCLNLKIEKSEHKNELKKLRENVEEMKANLMDKETELQNILEENEMLKLEIKNREMNCQVVADVEASRAAEVDAMTKLGYLMEEADKSNRKAARVTEQLESAQVANAEMEAELRRLKVQSDQWRKAAEAAASMLSPGSNGGKYVDGNYDNNPVGGRISSPYLDDYDDDSFKKKNGNVLKKIGVLWKKPQK